MLIILYQLSVVFTKQKPARIPSGFLYQLFQKLVGRSANVSQSIIVVAAFLQRGNFNLVSDRRGADVGSAAIGRTGMIHYFNRGSAIKALPQI